MVHRVGLRKPRCFLDEIWARFLGLAVLLAATAFTLWARFALGLMWSAVPAVKEGHQLRTSGPYAITRHPIYTGLLGMVLGTMLVAGAGPWIVPFPVALILIEFKIRIEERFMTAEFPEEYPRYRKRVPRVVPGLRLVTKLATWPWPTSPSAITH